MGCDIHLKLERRLKQDEKVIVTPEQKNENGEIVQKEISYVNKADEWMNCYIITYGTTWSNRTYGMFAKLANVRNYWNIKPIEQRGLPDDATNQTIAKYGYTILDRDPSKEEEDDWYELGWVGKSKAEKWINNEGCNVIEINGQKYVVNPDWHSPNWCTTQEMEDAINEIFFKDGVYSGDAEEWLALLGAMKGYEQSGKYVCRAVFWFDN